MPATYEALSQGGHEAMATEIFAKIKDYLDTHGADSKVSKAGDTMTGNLNINGMDINFKTTGSSSDDSGDIVFYYGNGQEKVRLWTANDYTAAAGINYRVYKKDGTSLYSGSLATYKQLNDYFANIGTENTADTWIPVWKSNHFEHCFRDIWTSVGHTNHATGKDHLVTRSVLSFWNGAYNSSGNSNLQYCDRGRFGTIVTKASNAYPTTTSLPSNYRVRCWTQVNNWGAVDPITPFTNKTLGAKFGVTSCTGGNTFLYCIIGDAAATSWYPAHVYYTNGNWRVSFNRTPSSANTRLTFFGVYFG